MDFFEAQLRARRRTAAIILWFAIAVSATIGAGYFAAYRSLTWVLHQPWVQQEFGAVRVPAIAVLNAIAIFTALVVGWACLGRWFALRGGGAAVAEWVGAWEIPTDTRDLQLKRVLNVVEEMAIASCLPVPSVYLMRDEPCINAFAAGFTVNDAVIVVTRGALVRLKRDELQGIVAHEFSHILNGDMRLNLRLAALLHGLMFVTVAGLAVLGRHRLDGVATESAILRRIGDTLSDLPQALLLMIIGFPGYFFARLVQGAVSRQREILADAAAVQFTRNPAGIVGALHRIDRLALRSHLRVEKALLIGHVFFAQGFRWQLGGLWATHPPLRARIRKLTPRWDSELVAKLEKLDDEESPFAPADDVADAVFSAQPKLPDRNHVPIVVFKPTVVVDDIGAQTEAHLSRTQDLLRSIAPRLRDAAHDPASASVLVYGLALGTRPADRAGQMQLVEQHAGAAAAAQLAALRPAISMLDPAARLPLVQLCAPALRTLEPTALERFLGTLDALMHSDATISPFEFVLQKMLVHHLRLSRPAEAAAKAHGREDAAAAIGVVLSACARLGATDRAKAEKAFAAGAAKRPAYKTRLTLLEPAACTLDHIDAALDELAASGPAVKKELLIAAAHVIGHDREVTLEEGELFRAVAAALDCPVPPLRGS